MADLNQKPVVVPATGTQNVQGPSTNPSAPAVNTPILPVSAAPATKQQVLQTKATTGGVSPAPVAPNPAAPAVAAPLQVEQPKLSQPVAPKNDVQTQFVNAMANDGGKQIVAGKDTRTKDVKQIAGAIDTKVSAAQQKYWAALNNKANLGKKYVATPADMQKAELEVSNAKQEFDAANSGKFQAENMFAQYANNHKQTISSLVNTGEAIVPNKSDVVAYGAYKDANNTFNFVKKLGTSVKDGKGLQGLKDAGYIDPDDSNTRIILSKFNPGALAEYDKAKKTQPLLDKVNGKTTSSSYSEIKTTTTTKTVTTTDSKGNTVTKQVTENVPASKVVEDKAINSAVSQNKELQTNAGEKDTLANSIAQNPEAIRLKQSIDEKSKQKIDLENQRMKLKTDLSAKYANMGMSQAAVDRAVELESEKIDQELFKVSTALGIDSASYNSLASQIAQERVEELKLKEIKVDVWKEENRQSEAQKNYELNVKKEENQQKVDAANIEINRSNADVNVAQQKLAEATQRYKQTVQDPIQNKIALEELTLRKSEFDEKKSENLRIHERSKDAINADLDKIVLTGEVSARGKLVDAKIDKEKQTQASTAGYMAGLSKESVNDITQSISNTKSSNAYKAQGTIQSLRSQSDVLKKQYQEADAIKKKIETLSNKKGKTDAEKQELKTLETRYKEEYNQGIVDMGTMNMFVKTLRPLEAYMKDDRDNIVNGESYLNQVGMLIKRVDEGQYLTMGQLKTIMDITDDVSRQYEENYAKQVKSESNKIASLYNIPQEKVDMIYAKSLGDVVSSEQNAKMQSFNDIETSFNGKKISVGDKFDFYDSFSNTKTPADYGMSSVDVGSTGIDVTKPLSEMPFKSRMLVFGFSYDKKFGEGAFMNELGNGEVAAVKLFEKVDRGEISPEGAYAYGLSLANQGVVMSPFAFQILKK